ncbi:hypothetical protein C0J52_23985 [Blattella germanica]|nr:hypothetical protein C0J52_23985 [Blattella germanica]
MGRSLEPLTPPRQPRRLLMARCHAPGCDELLGRMEAALGAAQRRVAELEADLQLHASAAMCQVHGPRLNRLASRPSSFPGHEDFYRSTRDIRRDYFVDSYGVWPPPV